MARYEHLPIYKAALDLTVHLEKLVGGFSRYHKYTLGTEMRNASRAMLLQVLKANNAGNANQRRDALLALRELIDALLLVMRVAKEVKALKVLPATCLRWNRWARLPDRTKVGSRTPARRKPEVCQFMGA